VERNGAANNKVTKQPRKTGAGVGHEKAHTAQNGRIKGAEGGIKANQG
jgi:hypothetical protein